MNHDSKSIFRLYALILAAILSASAPPAAAQSLYKVIDLTEINSTIASAESINDKGEIVGLLKRTQPQFAMRGYFLSGDSLSEIGTFGGRYSGADAVNESGQVVGLANTSGDRIFFAYRWQNGTLTNLGTLSGFYRSKAMAINNQGVVVGELESRTLNPANKAFRWENGVMKTLPALSDSGFCTARAINNSGMIVGSCETGPPFHEYRPLLWQGNNFIDLGSIGNNGGGGTAEDINDSGQVVGSAETSMGSGEFHAFLWKDSVMTDLAPLSKSSAAIEINNTGQVIGFIQEENFVSSPTIWQNGVASNVNNLIDPNSGWNIINVRGINNEGEIVATGFRNNQSKAVLLKPVPVLITSPAAKELWIAGEQDTIHWLARSDIALVDIFYSTDWDGQTGSFSLIVDSLSADAGQYIWHIPEDILSRNVIISISESAQPFREGLTDPFSIKDYSLTRIDNNGGFERFEPGKHGWQFSNSQVNMYPQDWYEQFDYLFGDDPFTENRYPDWFTDQTVNAAPFWFPDWPAYVRAFGTDTAYRILFPGRYGNYRESAAEKWGAIHGQERWGGSCSGFAISSLLAFGHKDDFAAAFPEIGAVDSIYSLGANILNSIADDPIRELINQLYVHWWGQIPKNHVRQVRNSTPRQTLEELKTSFLDTTHGFRGYLYISNVDTNGVSMGGAHAVAPYRMQRDPGNPGNRWQVYIYDPNRPAATDKFVTIDSTENSWSYPAIGSGGWGGPKGMYLMNGVQAHLNTATGTATTAGMFKSAPRARTTIDALPPLIEVYTSPGATTNITAAAGGVIGFADNAIHNSIEGAYANNPPTGFETPPVGFFLPPDAYTFELSNLPDSVASVSVFTDTLIYSYNRRANDAAGKDLVIFDNSMTVTNPDAQAKSVFLKSIAVLEDEERVFEIIDLPVASGDTLDFSFKNSAVAEIANRQSSGRYSLRIRRTTVDSSIQFVHENISLTGGSRHEIAPDWTIDALDSVKIFIDSNGDGSADDSLFVENEHNPTTGVTDEESTNVPLHYALSQNYPNPFNPTTTIRYDLPQSGFVTLKVFDLRGREVAALVNEQRNAGEHSVLFDASGLSSGVYFYKVQASAFTAIKKLLLVK